MLGVLDLLLGSKFFGTFMNKIALKPLLRYPIILKISGFS